MTQARTIVLLIAGLVLCAIAAAGGATVATWKAGADHAQELEQRDATIRKLEGEKSELKLAIADQNKSVAVAEAQTLAANQAKAKAEQHAADLAVLSKSRIEKLMAAFTSATSCDDVLKSYWELRR